MPSKQIPYGNYVGKLVKIYSNERIVINKIAKEEVSHVMNVIHTKLMNAFKVELGPSKKLTNGEYVSCAMRSIQKAIPGNLKKCALREAERQLTLYKNGVLQYNPEACLEALRANAARKASSRRTPKTKPAYDEFSAGISRILRTMNDRMTIENAAKQLIGYHLYELVGKIANSVTENIHEKTRMEPEDIRELLPDFFSPEILRYVLGEGVRKLRLYQAGIDTFKPKIKQPVVADADAPEGKASGKDKYFTGPEGHEPSLLFKDGIKKLLAGHKVQTKVDKLWMRDMAEILYDCAGSMTERIQEVSLKDNVDAIDFQEVDKVVHELFPRSLYQHAAHLGYRNVEKFFNGVLTYRKTLPSAARKGKKKSSRRVSKRKMRAKSPRRRKGEKIPKKTKISGEKAVAKSKSKRQEKEKRSAEAKRAKPPAKDSVERLHKKFKLDFTDSILKVLQLASHQLNVSVGREVTHVLNRHVADIYNALIWEAGKQESHVITPTQVRSAITSILPPELARLAISNYSPSALLQMHETDREEAMMQDDAGVAADEMDRAVTMSGGQSVSVDRIPSAEEEATDEQSYAEKEATDDQSSESEYESIPETEDLSTTATESESENDVDESELDTTVELPSDEEASKEGPSEPEEEEEGEET